MITSSASSARPCNALLRVRFSFGEELTSRLRWGRLRSFSPLRGRRDEGDDVSPSVSFSLLLLLPSLLRLTAARFFLPSVLREGVRVSASVAGEAGLGAFVKSAFRLHASSALSSRCFLRFGRDVEEGSETLSWLERSFSSSCIFTSCVHSALTQTGPPCCFGSGE